MILLDTHAWVWWVDDPAQLSRKARRALEREIEEQNKIVISAISAWEVARLVVKGRLQLTLEVQDWISKSEAVPFFDFLAVDTRIAVKAVLLPPPLHSDPADRIIIASALTLGAAVVTLDDKIRNYPQVRTIW